MRLHIACILLSRQHTQSCDHRNYTKIAKKETVVGIGLQCLVFPPFFYCQKFGMLQYNTILHNIRKQQGLSMLEYCICDSVYHLSKNPDMPRCTMSRETMAKFFDVSKRTVIRSIDKITKMWFIEKDEQTKYIRTSKIWYELAIINREIIGDKMSPVVTNWQSDGDKVAPDAVTKCHEGGDKMSHNNNIYNNKDIIIENNNVFDLKIWFDLFWNAYPRHTAKPVAEKSYIKAIGKKDQQAMHDKIMQWVQYLVDDIKSELIKKDYIPHASTWLNQERWQDEYRWPLYTKHHKHTIKPLKPFTPITMYDDNNNPTTHSAIDGAANKRSAITEHASTTRSSWSGLWSIFGELQKTEAEWNSEPQHL